MPFNIKIINLFHQFLNFQNARITKFNNDSALFADHMIMLLVSIGTFVVVLVFSKLLTLYQSTFYKQVQRIINCSSGYSGAGIFHIEKDIIGIKMPFRPVYFFQYHKTLRSLALIFFLQIGAENLFY